VKTEKPALQGERNTEIDSKKHLDNRVPFV